MNRKYYLWGLGGLGKRLIDYIPTECIKGIIDSDEGKIGSTINGLTVQGYSKELIGDDHVIIAIFDSSSVEKQLDKDGVKYVHITQFFTEWYWMKDKTNALTFVDLPITLKCTLNCKHCMQYLPLHSNVEDISLNDIVKWWDNLLNLYPSVMEVSLIGGEPFLHPNLGEIVEHIGKSSDVSIVITTNGMVFPSDDLITILKKNNVFVSMSDYSQTLPEVKQKINAFQQKLQDNDISAERKTHLWIDQGQFDCSIDSTEDCARTHFQLSDNKLWYCTLQCAGHKVGLTAAVPKTDFIDLSSDYLSSELYAFSTNEEKTTSCHKCGSRIGMSVPVAEQV